MEATILLPILAAVVILAAIVLTEIEHFGAATVTLVASVAALHYFDVFNVMGFVKSNFESVAIYTVAYFVAGIVWSFVKWFSYLYSFRDRYREAKEKFNSTFSGGNLDDAFRDYLNRVDKRDLLVRPSETNNKGRIIAWISLWPFSIIGTVLNDLVRRIYTRIYNHYKALYQKVVKYVFRNDPDLLDPPRK